MISVAKEINDPRYPSFMGIRKANRVDIPRLSADDLGGAGTSTRTWNNIRKPEVVKTDVVMIQGASPAEKSGQSCRRAAGRKDNLISGE